MRLSREGLPPRKFYKGPMPIRFVQLKEPIRFEQLKEPIMFEQLKEPIELRTHYEVNGIRVETPFYMSDNLRPW